MHTITIVLLTFLSAAALSGDAFAGSPTNEFERYAPDETPRRKRGAHKPKAQPTPEQIEAAELEQERQRIENEGVRLQIRKDAAALGFTDVDFASSLSETLLAVREGERTIKALNKTLIMLTGTDSYFSVFQVIDQNNVLLKERSTDLIVWLKGYKKAKGEITWMDGASLTAMEFNYVAIRGTKVYKTLIGSKQAIVIEPIL